MIARWRPDVFAEIYGDPKAFVNRHAITPSSNRILFERLDEFLQLNVSHTIVSEDDDDDDDDDDGG